MVFPPWLFNSVSFAFVISHQLVVVIMLSVCIAWHALVLIHFEISEWVNAACLNWEGKKLNHVSSPCFVNYFLIGQLANILLHYSTLTGGFGEGPASINYMDWPNQGHRACFNLFQQSKTWPFRSEQHEQSHLTKFLFLIFVLPVF